MTHLCTLYGYVDIFEKILKVPCKISEKRYFIVLMPTTIFFRLLLINLFASDRNLPVVTENLEENVALVQKVCDESSM